MIKVTRKNCIELIVASLILFAFLAIMKKNLYFVVPVPPLILLLLRPTIIMPLAKVWMGFGHILGTINSKILLSIVFFVLVTPVAIIRRSFSNGSMTNWKKNTKKDTMFILRKKSFKREDFDKAF